MSNYNASFTNINGVTYDIEIETEKGSNNGTFLLSGDPLNSSMDSDGKTLYAPIKCSAMTVSILTKDMPFDLYSGSAMGTKVNVKEDNKYIFKGFLTPCAYSMGFDNEIEEIQLECVDGISALKEIPYTTPKKEIKTFISIIFNCLKQCNCYKYLYINDNVQFTASGSESVLEKIRITEQNFHDKKDSDLQPDVDVAMSCYEVLFEIMQYFGYTLIADGENVYIVDYDAIIKGRTKYFRYDISGSSIGSSTSVNLSSSYHIKDGSYAESGNKIELTEVFNKLTVEDDFNEIESALDGLDNAKNLINITSNTDTTLKNWETNDSRFFESEVFTVPNKYGEDESFFVTLTKADDGKIFFVIGKFFSNPILQTYHYSHNNGTPTLSESNFNPMRYSKLWDGRGAIDVSYYTHRIESSQYNNWRAKIGNWNALSKDAKLEQFAKLTNIANIQSKKLTNYILCLNQDTNHIEHDKVRNYPYFKVSKDIPTVFGGKGAYLVIKGSVIRHYMYNAPFPQNGDCYVHKDEKSTIYSNEAYFWARLKWGNYYWKSEGSYTEQGFWTTTPSEFKIFYGDPTKEQKAGDHLDKSMKFYNNCYSLWGVDNEQGYYIPAPENENLSGTIEFTVYANKDTKGKWARNNKKDKKNSYNGLRPKVMLFKDIDITLGYSDDAMNEEAADSDTIYTNEVDKYSNIVEGEDIKMKICTYDNKTETYSTPDYLVNGKSQYIETLYNLATGYNLRQEEHLIMKSVNQYQEPKVIYEANLKNNIGFLPYTILTDKTLSGKQFIIDTIERDYRMNKATVRMIEKNKSYS